MRGCLDQSVRDLYKFNMLLENISDGLKFSFYENDSQ